MKEAHGWAVQEQKEILQAGLQVPMPKQMDSTGTRQRGVNKVMHILNAPFFNIFYTLSTKSRMDCLRALQGNPQGDVPLMWHPGMEAVLQASGISKADSSAVLALLSNQGASLLSMNDFTSLLEKHAAAIYAKKRVVSILIETLALYHYT